MTIRANYRKLLPRLDGGGFQKSHAYRQPRPCAHIGSAAAWRRNRQSNPSKETMNGVDVTALGETLRMLSQEPRLGAFQFRASNRWIGGGLTRSTIQGFYGAGEERSRPRAFTMTADEPPALIGGDQGANPVEFVLHALAACLTATMIYHAAARGIAIGAVSSELEGDIDVRGFMGLAVNVRKGYSRVRVKMNVESAAPAETLETLAKFSPVYDIVSSRFVTPLAIFRRRALLNLDRALDGRPVRNDVADWGA